VVAYPFLLGWAYDDRTEFFTREEMIRAFTLDKVNRAPASFDPQKLLAFEEHVMNELSVDERLERVLPFLTRVGLVPDGADEEVRARVRSIVEAAGDRIKVAGDILDYVDFFTPDDALLYDEKAFEKRIRKPADAVELLTAFRDVLASTDPFDPATLESRMSAFVGERELGIGRIIHAVRVATTGKAVGFGMFETLAILGKERALARIDRALAHARGEIEVERS